MHPRFPAPALIAFGLAGALLSSCTGSRQDTAGAASAPAPDGRTIVTAADLDQSPTQPIEQVLMARVPGIVVTRTPDGSLSIRIRGATSIEGRQDPLYVIDGVPIEPGPYGALTGINPYDIASIEVLKDAASTTLYGLRGANGVILIKTKPPGQ
ncbi:MAG TPA: TonB-dependent receptor plug domain-containing protein [Gemmatimonadaceae bacterium]|nr:TonB-dependent receptor plug domain-containing protein [Gemmatimonadaceae bacterium]